MIKKKFIISIICAIMVIGNSFSASAAVVTQNSNEQEYFQWNNVDEFNLYASVSSIKEFKFEIHSSIESSPFTINSTSVSITSYGAVYDSAGNLLSRFNGEKYNVILSLQSFPWTSKTAIFTVGSKGTKTITGLEAGKKYTVTVLNPNMDLASSGYHLIGNGSID